MSRGDEDRALSSLLASHPADVLRYSRLPYFLELFPSRKKVAKFIAGYLDLTGQLPSLKVVKRKHSGFLDGKPVKPEPLVACMNDLREELVDAVVTQYADDMSEAHSKQDVEGYVKLSEDMADKVRTIRAPIESGCLDSDAYTEQRLADLDKDASSLIRSFLTGLDPLDREWGGLRGGHIYVMSSLVNLGKTYVSAGIAENIRKQGHRVLYVSMEMPKNEIAERCLCLRYKLNVNHYIKMEQPEGSEDSKEDWYKKILLHRRDLEKNDKCQGRVFIMGNESGIIQPKTIRGVAREHAVEAIFIDACQDIRDNALSRDKVAGLYSALAELNALAVELNVPLFLTVQLQAEVEKKNIRSGNLANIAWGQVFAQKAHSVITMLGDRSTGKRDVKVDKSRDGQVGTPFNIELVFPNIEVIATDLQAVGISLTEDDVFESPDDLDAYQKLMEDIGDPSQPLLTPKTPAKSYKIQEDPEPTNSEPSDYEKRQAERAKKRLKSKLKRGHHG